MRPRALTSSIAVFAVLVVAAGCDDDGPMPSATGGPAPSEVSAAPPPASPDDRRAVPNGRAGDPMYGLQREALGYRLDVTEVLGRGGQAIQLDLTRNGEPLRSIESDFLHVFAMTPGVTAFTHEPHTTWSNWLNVSNTGPTSVVVVFADDGNQLVLGADVDVTEESDFGGGLPNPTQTELVHGSGVIVERDGWSFTVTGSRDQEPLAEAASLTVIRRDDLALSYESLEQTGDGVYRFDPAVPGAGDYVAVLEITGAPRFSFDVSVDDDGSFVSPPGADVIDAVAAFVTAVDVGAIDEITDMLSARCRTALQPSLDDELALLVEARPHVWLTSAVADAAGDRATVDYVTISGDYTIGQTPNWRGRHETWVREDGRWSRDTCEADVFNW